MTDDKRRETEFMRRELEELRREVRRLRREVMQDDLTGLYNARALREQLEDFVDDCLVNGREPSLLFLDIDRFKETNEVHGHEAGGQILRQMGQLIARFVRAEDIAFRYGGDEF
jgi:diguanylate cyclase (GGDEF)-like protein